MRTYFGTSNNNYIVRLCNNTNQMSRNFRSFVTSTSKLQSNSCAVPTHCNASAKPQQKLFLSDYYWSEQSNDFVLQMQIRNCHFHYKPQHTPSTAATDFAKILSLFYQLALLSTASKFQKLIKLFTQTRTQKACDPFELFYIFDLGKIDVFSRGRWAVKKGIVCHE